ncbi:hypothetical protein [Flavobacterium capsici]|uniref:Uncharacterized protein n=1 Tax=Flavobacterium capsici TaxID=3075618 RepID=A0AA96EUB8_9FLAO|nr:MULTISPECIES: hypothetical protein [unclassified Flavobacterium]WNM18459.1 hypothetical protein RN608_10595 [Flavobacterium sp. PMR2A8]WNM22510.1 hypothetical protein RN605_03895 [Flavobacterium sp. PMTSA4]
MKLLNHEQKAGLIDLFAPQRKYTFIIMIVLVVGFLFLAQSGLLPMLTLLSLYFWLLILLVILKAYHTNQLLKANNYPDAYIKNSILASSLAFLGLLLFSVLMLLSKM